MSTVSSLRPGDRVEWWHVSRGGYGYGTWVPAVVVRAPGTANPEGRVRISIKRADGSLAERTVYRKNLRLLDEVLP